MRVASAWVPLSMMFLFVVVTSVWYRIFVMVLFFLCAHHALSVACEGFAHASKLELTESEPQSMEYR